MSKLRLGQRLALGHTLGVGGGQGLRFAHLPPQGPHRPPAAVHQPAQLFGKPPSFRLDHLPGNVFQM